MIAAPYPADVRAKGWRFEIDHERVEQSSTWTLAAPEVRPWLLMLWMTAWKQTPCGSLDDDDALICARIGMPAKLFAKHRAILMRGWMKAEDGRLYHETITERVRAMLEKRSKDTSRKSLFDAKTKLVRDRDGHACVYCAAKTYLSLDHLIAVSRGGSGEESNLVTACRRCNSVKGARTPDEAGLSFVNKDAERIWHAARTLANASVTRYQPFITQAERGSDDTKHQAPETSNQRPEKSKSIARGSRLPDDFEPDFDFAVEQGIANTLEEASKFRDYWRSQPGQKGVKTDWPATWRNWCRNAKQSGPSPFNGSKQSALEARNAAVLREMFEGAR